MSRQIIARVGKRRLKMSVIGNDITCGRERIGADKNNRADRLRRSPTNKIWPDRSSRFCRFRERPVIRKPEMTKRWNPAHPDMSAAKKNPRTGKKTICSGVDRSVQMSRGPPRKKGKNWLTIHHTTRKSSRNPSSEESDYLDKCFIRKI